MSRTSGCYVHIPFCVKKCAYCDFNSYSGYGESLIKRYNSAIIREIENAPAPDSDEIVDTIFFGGGTPTAIPAVDEVRILHTVQNRLQPSPDSEITTEANPGTADIAGLEILRTGGFNRISFGVQSFDPGLLQTIDRIHSADEAKTAVHAAHRAGFENISIDLMFGLPGQTMAQWRDTLEQALELKTDHLSMYALIVEDGTGFGTMARKGLLHLPLDDLVADMYLLAMETAENSGYTQYEISNFAKSGYECRHNIHYWRGDEYYGFGAGAVSFRENTRRTNQLAPGKYAACIEKSESLILESEFLTQETQQSEAMMLGLRMTQEGVNTSNFQKRFGYTPADLWPDRIAKFASLGLLHSDSNHLVLTRKGVLYANDVMAAFL